MICKIIHCSYMHKSLNGPYQIYLEAKDIDGMIKGLEEINENRSLQNYIRDL